MANRDTYATACKRLAFYLPQLRAACNMTQQDLADRVHVSRSLIALFESGRPKLTKDTYNEIINVLNKDDDARYIMDLYGIHAWPSDTK